MSMGKWTKQDSEAEADQFWDAQYALENIAGVLYRWMIYNISCIQLAK